MEEIRLQKYLAQCGVASRRGAEQIIRDGRVAVNGVVVTEMGTKLKKNLSSILYTNFAILANFFLKNLKKELNYLKINKKLLTNKNKYAITSID